MGTSPGNIVDTGLVNEIRDALKGAIDLILPYRCAVCGGISDTEDRFEAYNSLYKDLFGQRPDLHICGKCLSSLNIQDEDRRWFLCLSNPVAGDPCPGLPLYMPFEYRGLVEQILPKIKFGKKYELARFFGCVLGSAIKGENISADLIVPVPLSSRRFEERGFNQAGEIAYPLARLNGIPYADDCLIRVRDTMRQSDISDKGLRAVNVSNAFSVSEDWDVTGLTAVVVDDVATTGSTLHEAAIALYKAGASKVLCAAFAGNRSLKNAEPY